MSTHRVRGDHQLGRDLPGALALCHAGQHVQLARTQGVQQVAALPGRLDIVAQPPDDLAQHLGREPGVAAGHAAQHGLELVGALALGHPGVRPGPGRVHRVGDLLVRADHDDPGIRPGRPDPAQDLGDGDPEGFDIDEHDVRA
jgi:hypothetical protein